MDDLRRFSFTNICYVDHYGVAVPTFILIIHPLQTVIPLTFSSRETTLKHRAENNLAIKHREMGSRISEPLVHTCDGESPTGPIYFADLVSRFLRPPNSAYRGRVMVCPPGIETTHEYERQIAKCKKAIKKKGG